MVYIFEMFSKADKKIKEGRRRKIERIEPRDGRKEPMSKFFRVTLEQVKLFKTFFAEDRAQLRSIT
jgi:hypothetical protein